MGIMIVPMSGIHDLKTTGLKVTTPRLKVLDIFHRAQSRHLTAEDVYRALLAESVDIGLATVYRVLTQFEQAGILTRSHFESDKAVFELDQGGHHDHLVCLDCGRVEEFFDSQIEDRQRRVAEEKGFKLQEHSLSLYGHCTRTNCAFRKSADKPELTAAPAALSPQAVRPKSAKGK